MFSKISVLVPTRGRVARLRTLFESFEQTVNNDAELVFRVDDDDTESFEFLQGQPLATAIVVGPRLDGYRSLPMFFNELVDVATGDVLMCGNDDMVFKTVGWSSMMLYEANKYQDGLFDLGVQTHNDTHFPFATVSRKAVKCVGFLFDTRIFWGDIFWRDVMAYFGRCEMLDVQIDHDWAGITPDRVFLEGETARRSDWTTLHAIAVSEAVEKLRSLL